MRARGQIKLAIPDAGPRNEGEKRMTYIGLGNCPYMEKTENTKKFFELLQKKFPKGRFGIKEGEVVIRFDPENEAEVEYAFMVDENIPANW